MNTMATTNNGPYCDLDDTMPAAWCAHCRDKTGISDRTRIRASRPTGDEVRHRFTARYSGTCARCGERYLREENIGVTLDGDYVCQDCCQ